MVPIFAKETHVSQPITPDHIYELATVSEPSLSPDGTRLVFTQSNIDRDGWNEYVAPWDRANDG